MIQKRRARGTYYVPSETLLMNTPQTENAPAGGESVPAQAVTGTARAVTGTAQAVTGTVHHVPVVGRRIPKLEITNL